MRKSDRPQVTAAAIAPRLAFWSNWRVQIVRGRAWLRTLGVSALALAGCATPAMQYPGIEVVPQRLAAFPSDGVEWTYDFSGTRMVDREGSVTAQKNVDDSINYRLRRRGGHSFRADALDRVEQGRAFYGWVIDAMSEIMAERLGLSKQRHTTVGDWRFSGGLESWRGPLDADFVLVSMFIDGHNTPGRALAVSLAGGWRAAQRAIFCVVHLESGRIVWCNFDGAINRDLRMRAQAQEEVDWELEKTLLVRAAAPTARPPRAAGVTSIAPIGDSPPPPATGPSDTTTGLPP